MATVKPGVVLEELEAAWRRVIARHGIEKDSRIGYPVGIGYPPTWGELTCSLRRGDRTVLEPGMTFHCIPALWLETYGLVVSETFVVTETGAETFANLPRRLFYVDAWEHISSYPPYHPRETECIRLRNRHPHD